MSTTTTTKNENKKNLVLPAKDADVQEYVNGIALAHVADHLINGSPDGNTELAMLAHVYRLGLLGKKEWDIPGTKAVTMLRNLGPALIEDMASVPDDLEGIQIPSKEELKELLKEFVVHQVDYLNAPIYQGLGVDTEKEAVSKAEEYLSKKQVANESIGSDDTARILRDMQVEIERLRSELELERSKTDSEVEGHGHGSSKPTGYDKLIRNFFTSDANSGPREAMASATKAGWEDASKSSSYTGSGCAGSCKSGNEGMSGWAIAALAVGAVAAAYGAYSFFSEDETDVVLLDE